MEIKKYHRLFTLLAICLTIGVLGWLVYRQRETLLLYPWRFHPLPALLSLILFSIAMYASALIWAWMLNTLGKRVNIRRHLRNYTLSNVTKRLPGTVWYIASRAQMYREENIDVKLTSLVSAMEMAVIILSGLVVSLIFAIPIILQYRVSPWILGGIFFVALSLLLPRSMEWIFRLFKVQASSFRYRDILGWLAAYGLVWILGGIILFTIANIVSELPLRSLGFVIGSWTIVGVLSSALLFSPSNFGVTEIGLSLLLSQVMPSPVAVVVAILVRVLLILFEIGWAVVWLGLDFLSKKQ
jgi:hypothetical protein